MTLIAEHDRDTSAREGEIGREGCVGDCLEADDAEALRPEFVQGGLGRLAPLPRDVGVRAHRGALHLRVLGRRRVPAQPQAAYSEAVGGSEEGSHVECRAQMIQDKVEG